MCGTLSNEDQGFNPITCDTQGIPRDISVNLVNIEAHKKNKYKFPMRDSVDPNSWTTKFTKEQCIENILNLSACRLDAETYDFWNLVAKRDVAFEELSTNGIQATKYDLKHQSGCRISGHSKQSKVFQKLTLKQTLVKNSLFIVQI